MALSNKKSPNSQPYRMLILAPYDGFEIMINKVIADRKDILADVYQAPVDHVEAVLSGLNLNKYEVVICRGRSSYIASQIVDLPVVTVEFSPMDILRGLRLAATNQKKMAFVSFFKMEETIRFLANFMNIPESTFIVPPAPESNEEMQQLILDLHMEYGVDLFIGDGACMRTARQYGFDYILITSGSECIESALSSAIEICDMGRALVAKNSFYRSALLNTGYHFAIFKEDKDLCDTNITRSIAGNQVITSMKSHISAVLRHGSINYIAESVSGNFKIKGTLFEQDNMRYVLFICFEAFKINKHLSGFISYREPPELNEDLRLVNSVSSLSKLLTETMKHAPGLTPVIITGFQGSGKTTFARSIYLSGAYTQSSLAEIDCKSINKKNLSSLICDDVSPLYETNTVLILKNLDAMPIELQQEFADSISGMEFKRRIKIIATVSGKLTELIPAKKLSSDLAYLINGHTVDIPPLHNNIDLISSIARSYLNELNQTLPEQLAGFEPAALDKLAAFNWNYGITQFKLTIKRLASNASSAFITEAAVEAVLSEYQAAPIVESVSDNCIELNGSLEDITHKVILKVLDKEDMNQCRAAKRLGISRMTVWKHLNEKKPSTPPRIKNSIRSLFAVYIRKQGA